MDDAGEQPLVPPDASPRNADTFRRDRKGEPDVVLMDAFGRRHKLRLTFAALDLRFPDYCPQIGLRLASGKQTMHPLLENPTYTRRSSCMAR